MIALSQSPANDIADRFMECWYPNAGRLDVQLTAPGLPAPVSPTVSPGDPPTTSTPPASYFDPVGERDGTSARSAGSMRKARGGPASAPGRPIGSSITSPV